MQPEGLSQVADLVSFYKENAAILSAVTVPPASPISSSDGSSDWGMPRAAFDNGLGVDKQLTSGCSHTDEFDSPLRLL